MNILTAGGCGLTMLFGVDVLGLDTGQWAAIFVASRVFGLLVLAFNSALAVEVWRNRS